VNSWSCQKPIQDPTNSSGFGGVTSFVETVAGNDAPSNATMANIEEVSFTVNLARCDKDDS